MKRLSTFDEFMTKTWWLTSLELQ